MKAFKAFTKPFEVPQRNVEIKIQVNFLSSSETGMGRVKPETEAKFRCVSSNWINRTYSLKPLHATDRFLYPLKI